MLMKYLSEYQPCRMRSTSSLKTEGGRRSRSNTLIGDRLSPTELTLSRPGQFSLLSYVVSRSSVPFDLSNVVRLFQALCTQSRLCSTQILVGERGPGGSTRGHDRRRPPPPGEARYRPRPRSGRGPGDGRDRLLVGRADDPGCPRLLRGGRLHRLRGGRPRLEAPWRALARPERGPRRRGRHGGGGGRSLQRRPRQPGLVDAVPPRRRRVRAGRPRVRPRPGPPGRRHRRRPRRRGPGVAARRAARPGHPGMRGPGGHGPLVLRPDPRPAGQANRATFRTAATLLSPPTRGCSPSRDRISIFLRRRPFRWATAYTNPPWPR
jgi:hypothetical protein